MENNLKISVIVPVYNSEKYIGRCIRSLLKQTIKKSNYELIIINDSSKDHSLREIKKYKSSNIKVISNKKNLGLPASLNLGIKNCTGSFVVRVDSDDWVHSDFLYMLSSFLIINQNLDAVACDYVLTNSKEITIEEKNCDKFPIGCGIMFKLQHLLEMGLYDEKFKYAEEEAIRKKFLENYKITRIPLTLYRYRQHKNNRSKNKKMVKKYSESLKNG